jgi:threonine dehydratase
MENRNVMNTKISIIPDFSNIIEAHKRISSFIKYTPVLTSQSINKICKSDIYFKCENFQKVGAFKFRGATNAVRLLDKTSLNKGVATHSSGNHAAALALAAAMLDTRCYVVMPETAPEIKKAAVKSYGAEIIFCAPTLEARERTLQTVIEQTGASFIHPYNNPNVIAGQGTAALELLKEIDGLDVIIAPVGGGGLLSGTAISARNLRPGIQIIGAEPEMADDAYRSFQKKQIIPSVNPKTIADGLLTSLGDLTFEIIISKVDRIVTVSESSIILAMRMIWERMKIVIEPSSAVPLAAVIQHNDMFAHKKIGIIVSGGNVDITKLPF